MKKIEQTVEVPAQVIPAKTKTVVTFQCEQCPASFTSESAATKHLNEKHSFTDHKTLAGYLGDSDETPSGVRGDEVYHFVTEEAFNAFRGYTQGSVGNGRWEGPGWYVASNREIQYHNSDTSWYTDLRPLGDLERELTDYFVEVTRRLRSVRALTGPRCSSCQGLQGQHTKWCSI